MLGQLGRHKSYTKGIGFVIASDGQEFYYTAKDLTGKPPKEGDVLTFDLAPSREGDGKFVATNVQGGTAGGASRGIVRNFSARSGYGFIEIEGVTHFVHHSSIVDNVLQDDDIVWCDIIDSPKKPGQTECANVAGGTGRPKCAEIASFNNVGDKSEGSAALLQGLNDAVKSRQRQLVLDLMASRGYKAESNRSSPY
eukprot:TRINITY_DN26750_c0_g1_i1.p1 TRINITY_DN26750_c0_g1~~TRINITY_DN26750_c0_g1_i1.p1  ORF type:complete len:196 (-),score=29.29 TRINITY_DN26750_c0_g1_i1:202-789(-)